MRFPFFSRAVLMASLMCLVSLVACDSNSDNDEANDSTSTNGGRQAGGEQTGGDQSDGNAGREATAGRMAGGAVGSGGNGIQGGMSTAGTMAGGTTGGIPVAGMSGGGETAGIPSSSGGAAVGGSTGGMMGSGTGGQTGLSSPACTLEPESGMCVDICPDGFICDEACRNCIRNIPKECSLNDDGVCQDLWHQMISGSRTKIVGNTHINHSCSIEYSSSKPLFPLKSMKS